MVEGDIRAFRAKFDTVKGLDDFMIKKLIENEIKDFFPGKLL